MKLDSKYFDRIRVRRKGAVPPDQSAPTCQWDGCNEKGLYRAPVGRHAEGEYFLFCVDHVRQYNKGYNYFAGLSDSDIARYQKEALTGHRPTWAVGVNGIARGGRTGEPAPSASAGFHTRFRDPFGFVDTVEAEPVQTMPRPRKLKPLENKAFETLGLEADASRDDIKARYKVLVKRHHPDANGGDRGSEERFRAVVQAYRLLKQSGFC